jgi:hypothetical protein
MGFIQLCLPGSMLTKHSVYRSSRASHRITDVVGLNYDIVTKLEICLFKMNLKLIGYKLSVGDAHNCICSPDVER